jgi:tRNA 2-thiouridine synthesizing protein E
MGAPGWPPSALFELEVNSKDLQLADGRSIELDEKGYMKNPGDWTPDIAERMAGDEGIQLSSDHWEILEIFRDYFAEFDIEPPMRALVRRSAERLGSEKGNSRYLYRLFPDGPATQACRYAGLPRPVSCI